MQPPAYLIKKGIESLPTLGDGRQSGTSDSPSILHASPESAVGGGLALLKDGDIIEVNLNKNSCNVLLSDEELASRRKNLKIEIVESKTPWQEIYRNTVSQLSTGAVIESALKFKQVGKEPPRYNH